ncbi:DUF2314 domain-containing protein [Flavobacterium hercynium]|uniref:DUF2314 domain-containing protein n=1 Tax=Flavobacterium hercynium TaxID=387094 RepID=A0A226HN23_9FLAO|nr:DUF2314 domain-containing protein [Flavobacterium hercynium]OXA94910.1 hypothetical protein B0A66_04090 [Flavobacterium hercynium]SMP09321.1 Uncharacterized conserved protein YegJ, DUF2314 family [Flavobacterium hercynium]
MQNNYSKQQALQVILFFIFSIVIQAQVKNNVEKTGATQAASIFKVEDDDIEMANAILKAKQTFNEFETAIRSENSNLKGFSLKKGYQSYKGVELLWIANIMVYEKKNKYVGIVKNVPEYTKDVKYDDITEISNDEVSDWLYLDNGVVKGGYTLRLLRNRMTAAERKQFDAESHLIFD